MKKITRRGIVAAIGVGGAGVCVCGMKNGCSSITKVGKTPLVPIGSYEIGKNALIIDIEKVPQLAEVGGSVKIIDQLLNDPLIVAHINQSEFAVVSLLCTHRGCELEYRPEHSDFRCSSLGSSKFKTDGAKISGFAKKSLKQYAASIDSSSKNLLVVTLDV